MQTRKLSIHTFFFCFNARYPCQRNNATKLQKQHPIPVKDAWYPIGIDLVCSLPEASVGHE